MPVNTTNPSAQLAEHCNGSKTSVQGLRAPCFFRLALATKTDSPSLASSWIRVRSCDQQDTLRRRVLQIVDLAVPQHFGTKETRRILDKTGSVGREIIDSSLHRIELADNKLNFDNFLHNPRAFATIHSHETLVANATCVAVVTAMLW
jgi:hypothetical protein